MVFNKFDRPLNRMRPQVQFGGRQPYMPLDNRQLERQNYMPQDNRQLSRYRQNDMPQDSRQLQRQNYMPQDKEQIIRDEMRKFSGNMPNGRMLDVANQPQFGALATQMQAMRQGYQPQQYQQPQQQQPQQNRGFLGSLWDGVKGAAGNAWDAYKQSPALQAAGAVAMPIAGVPAAIGANWDRLKSGGLLGGLSNYRDQNGFNRR